MPFDRKCIINTVQALCIFTTLGFALDSCLATKITPLTIFFIKCVAFHHLPFVYTHWQLHYLYAKPDMRMPYIRMWGHSYIHIWQAWFLLGLLLLLALHAALQHIVHAVQCAAILKQGCIIFSWKRSTDHLSNSSLVVFGLHEFPLSLFFLLSLLSDLRVIALL